jgi:hypothetical protein
MSRDALACIFGSAPIRDCGRPTTLEPVLASSWPLAALFAVIVGLCGYAYLRSIYGHDIDWDQEPLPRARLRPVEDVSRDAGA